MFKVGDIITGRDAAFYSDTTHRATMKVINVLDSGTIRVKILKHLDYPNCVGRCHNVSPEYFVLVRRPGDDEPKKGLTKFPPMYTVKEQSEINSEDEVPF